ncbi:MAG TPA: hypothetical protein VFT21_12700 [Gemmatimonadaceae bacterium]|nr:hypothetical protein [Gemmatimonadaceae bacterium]
MGTAEELKRVTQVDAVLLPLVTAKDAGEADAITERIISDETLPLVRRIIAAKLKRQSFDFRDAQETDDLKGDVIVRLLSRLERCRLDVARYGIANWRGYVGATTRHACDEYLRQKHPRRHSLENKLRYLFTHRPHLAIWQTDEGDFRCGREAWRNRDTPCESVRVVLEDSSVLDRELPQGRSTASDLTRLVDRFLNRVGGPIDLDDLIEIVARVWQVRDHDSTPVENPNSASPMAHVDQGTEIERQVSTREELHLLWAEILELPAKQRAALLLNMKDDACMLLPITGVASIQEIARALGRAAEDFASLWTRLPLDDVTIGAELGVTPQQVINLRKAARARLGRRLKTLAGNIAPV